MNLQALFTSSTGTGLAFWLGRAMPPRLGFAVVRLVVGLVLRQRNSPLVRSIRLNQSVVRGLPFDAPELDQAVRAVLLNAGRGYYEFYHLLGQGPEALARAVTIEPSLWQRMEHNRAKNIGTMVIGPHLSNFDLVAAAFAVHHIPVQLITFALPPGGYELQNRLRADAGYVVTPAGAEAVKLALRRLQQGGIVATGIDRPLPEDQRGEPVSFFGRPAPLPTGYARLALSADAEIDMAFVSSEADGTYQLSCSPPIELVRTGNRRADAIATTERVLAAAAEAIRDRPDEWMMFFPVWPDLMPPG